MFVIPTEHELEFFTNKYLLIRSVDMNHHYYYKLFLLLIIIIIEEILNILHYYTHTYIYVTIILYILYIL